MMKYAVSSRVILMKNGLTVLITKSVASSGGSIYRSRANSASSKKSSRSSISSKSSTNKRFMEEKLKIAELPAEQSFKGKRRAAEDQVEKLRIEEEVAKVCVKINVFEAYSNKTE